MSAILYKGKVYGAGGSIIEGYYKVADGKFYEESTYTTEIPGAEDLLYIDLTSKMQFIFDGTNFVNITEDAKPTVTEASSRTNIASGDTLKTIISKIKKFFADLKTVAFSGSYNDLSDTPSIPTITDTYSGTSSDGMSGKAVKQGLDTLITETDTTNTKPYLYRPTQTTGDRLYDKLVGCSFAVNQLVQNGNFASTSGWTVRNGTLTASSNEATFTAAASNYNQTFRQNIALITGRKYLVRLSVKKVSGNVSKIYYGLNNDLATANAYKTPTISTSYTEYAAIFYPTSTVNNITIGMHDGTTSGDVIRIKNVNVIDLTQMFGTAIANEAYAKEQASAGSGISWLRSYGFFGKDYYAYNAGAIASVMPTAHKMVGKNLLNYDAWKSVGTTRGTSVFINNGVKITATSADAFTDYDPNGTFPSGARIKVNSGLKIVLSWKETTNASGSVFIFAYRSDNTIISFNSVNNNTYKSFPYTVPDGTAYITFRFGVATSGATIEYKDIQCEIGLSATDYVPYEEYTYPLTTELRGIPTLVDGEIVYDGDINEGDGSTQRKYGTKDMGSLDWQYYGSGVFYITDDLGEARKTGITYMSGKYNGANNVDGISLVVAGADKIICGYSNTNYHRIYVKDTAYTDAATFKTAMSGVYLVYELATPTTEVSVPFTNPQICDKNGTEEYIDSRDMPIPVGHNTKYVDVPDWMEDGYYKDFRDRADSLFSPSVEVIATNVGSVPVYVTQSQLERYSMIAMVVFAKPFSSQSKIMAGTTYILTKSLVDGMAIQLDLSKTYNTSEITYYTGYFAIMLGSDLHHVDIYGIR